MSNNDMVSVPRELTQMAADAIDDLLADGVSAISAAAWVDVSQQLRAILAQPAEQHQGEPVALPAKKYPPDWNKGTLQRCNMEYMDGWNACLDEIAKLGPLYTHPAPADPGEVERLRKTIDGMNDAHWKVVQDNAALRGEVERLRAELESERGLRRKLAARFGQYKDEAKADADCLRAQLAERDALLSGIHDGTISGFERYSKIEEILSASAEPSGNQRTVGSDYFETAFGPEPSAPVDRDERAEFEACIRREWPMAPISRKRDLLPKDDPCYGDYCDEPLQRAWVGWQMRATLECKP